MGKIVSIKKFEIHDGDGIRTTLFLKGCPLKCRWCHNPESISLNPVILYNPQKCIGCGECVNVCNNHRISENTHIYNRKDCVVCGKCTDLCYGKALNFYGEETTAEQILPKLLEDKIFFETSGGGVTLSGGEPLLQADFSAEILKLLKENNINTAVDTSGFAKREELLKVLPYADTFLYDIKAMDEDLHISLTGVSNKIILENLEYLNSLNKDIRIRIPFVPGLNDNQIEKIAKYLSKLESVREVKLLPYHSFGVEKYLYIGESCSFTDNTKPSGEELNKAIEILKKYSLKVVKE